MPFYHPVIEEALQDALKKTTKQLAGDLIPLVKKRQQKLKYN